MIGIGVGGEEEGRWKKAFASWREEEEKKKIVSHFAIKTDVNADLVKFSSFNEANKHVLYPVEPADGLFTRYLVSLIHFMGHFFLGYGLSEEQHMACNLC